MHDMRVIAGRHGWQVAVCGVVAWAAFIAVTRPADAGKPGGGGGGDDTGGGTVYFEVSGRLWTMASDGSGRTALAVELGNGMPGYQIHAGSRWFLDRQSVAGTYPDGSPRNEVFAIRVDGLASVQLTSDANVNPLDLRWRKDDSAFSYTAVDWSTPGTPVSRLRVVGLTFDASGVPAVSGTGADVLTLASVSGSGWKSSTIGSHDWSPAGDRVAWSDRSGAMGLLRVTTAATGATATLAEGFAVSWSAQDRILFNGADGVECIDASGANRRVLVKWAPTYGVAGVDWSPTGSHFVYLKYTRTYPEQSDLYRATSSGGSKTELTGDVADRVYGVAWR